MTGLELEQKLKKDLNKKKRFFETDATKTYGFRMWALEKLEKAIRKNEKAIASALNKDLNKSSMESYMTETGMALSEITYIKKNLKKWMLKEKLSTPLALAVSKSYLMKEPFGSVLVIAPWNYPFLLAIQPLIGAIAAGNCVTIKPSEIAPATSKLLKKMISEIFPVKYVSVVEGGKETSQALLKLRYDYIFYTGGVPVGKIVMEEAAKNLIPVTLELGGKSPCIIDETADIEVAARRIAFGKCLNAGQTGIAPDYVLVHKKVKAQFVACYKKAVEDMLGSDPLQNKNYPKIINRRHFERINQLLDGQNILYGGQSSETTNQIAPVLLDEPAWDSKVMQEEIFGPILPILSFNRISSVIKLLKRKEKPLALYLFTNNRYTEKMVMQKLSFGGGCVNDTIMHVGNPVLPFGGVGNSGMGSYHGKYSFDTFSHKKSIVSKSNAIDIALRYQPYTRLKSRMVKRFLR